jgi:hypothetical protein
MPSPTETRLPWGQDTITIKGRNAGVQALTVHFDGETLNIVDFLNHSLKAEYASLYETIMSKYEAKLKNNDIFAHNFPEAKIACKEITAPPLFRTVGTAPASAFPAGARFLIQGFLFVA